MTVLRWNQINPALPHPTPTLNLVVHGDSMSLTGGVLQIHTPRVAALILAGGVDAAQWTRCGINGASYNYAWPDAGYPYTLIQDAPLRVDPMLSLTLPNWLIVLAGTNGIVLGGHSAATEYADFQAYIAARILAGWPAGQIVVSTMMPRTGLSEVTRGAYNTSVVNGAVTYGYQLARLDLNPNIGAAGQNLDTTYFLDGTHPTDLGQSIVASIEYGVM